jgi:hypothetical protein
MGPNMVRHTAEQKFPVENFIRRKSLIINFIGGIWIHLYTQNEVLKLYQKIKKK